MCEVAGGRETSTYRDRETETENGGAPAVVSPLSHFFRTLGKSLDSARSSWGTRALEVGVQNVGVRVSSTRSE